MILLLGLLAAVACSSCDPKTRLNSWKEKVQLTQFSTVEDPYTSLSPAEKAQIAAVIADDSRVCGLKYTDTHTYVLRNFPDADAMKQEGFHLTHYGVCGYCSSLHDLSIYLTMDLTQPARICAAKAFVSEEWSLGCYMTTIGFSRQCAYAWLWDSQNTKRHCKWICMWSWLSGEPIVVGGKINQCIQCDEDYSGDLFKYFAGRNRRNSGIVSELTRDEREVRPVDHCKY